MKSKQIYLDQNIWIALARAYHKRQGGQQYYSTLQRAQTATQKGKAIFPLSAAHLIETRKKSDLSQRKRLAQVMVELSRGWTLAPSDYLVPRELQIAIANLFSQTPIPGPIALGRGVAFAFGRAEKLHDDLAISKERADRLQASFDCPSGLTQFLIGDHEPANIRSVNNFHRTASLLAQRLETARALGKNYSKAVRKRAYLAQLTCDLQPELTRLLSLYGKGLDDFLGLGKNGLTAFFEKIPTLNTEIELATERDEHWDRPIAPNDMVDLSVLSVAIPYCHIVVTERFWAALAKRKKLDKKYNTVLLSDPSDLEDHLNGDAP